MHENYSSILSNVISSSIFTSQVLLVGRHTSFSRLTFSVKLCEFKSAFAKKIIAWRTEIKCRAFAPHLPQIPNANVNPNCKP